MVTEYFELLVLFHQLKVSLDIPGSETSRIHLLPLVTKLINQGVVVNLPIIWFVPQMGDAKPVHACGLSRLELDLFCFRSVPVFFISSHTTLGLGCLPLSPA